MAIEDGLFKFSSMEQLHGWDTVLGLQFENLVLNHVADIFPQLGLEHALVLSAVPVVKRKTKSDPGFQIDLLMDEFADAFVNADHVVLAEIYAAREKNIYKLSSRKLLETIKEKHPKKDVCYFDDFNAIADFVYNNAVEGDLVITMGAGDIYRVGEIIMEKDAKQ